MYALVYEYHDRPMFPIPIVIHLCRIVVICYHKIQDYCRRNDKERKIMYGSAFRKSFKIHDLIPILIQLCKIVVFCYNKLSTDTKCGNAFRKRIIIHV